MKFFRHVTFCVGSLSVGLGPEIQVLPESPSNQGSWSWSISVWSWYGRRLHYMFPSSVFQTPQAAFAQHCTEPCGDSHALPDVRGWQ